ncbi:MAG: hypothetical protein Q7J59_00740 [Elusimicrobiota bacterium]|nr:hypothetical protein [Elusimicrobiota bacterium]
MARLVVTIPKNEFERVEREKKDRGITRSAFIHQIIDFFFRKEDESKKEAKYIAGYKKHPENIKKIDEAVRFALDYPELGKSGARYFEWRT